jgi:hypothetical protein
MPLIYSDFFSRIHQRPFVARMTSQLKSTCFGAAFALNKINGALILFNRTRFITLGWQHSGSYSSDPHRLARAINSWQMQECSAPSTVRTHLESFSL